MNCLGLHFLICKTVTLCKDEIRKQKGKHLSGLRKWSIKSDIILIKNVINKVILRTRLFATQSVSHTQHLPPDLVPPTPAQPGCSFKGGHVWLDWSFCPCLILSLGNDLWDHLTQREGGQLIWGLLSEPIRLAVFGMCPLKYEEDWLGWSVMELRDERRRVILREKAWREFLKSYFESWYFSSSSSTIDVTSRPILCLLLKT